MREENTLNFHQTVVNLVPSISKCRQHTVHALCACYNELNNRGIDPKINKQHKSGIDVQSLPERAEVRSSLIPDLEEAVPGSSSNSQPILGHT